MSLTPALFTSLRPDGPNLALLQPSYWNRVTSLFMSLVDGTDANPVLFVPIGSTGNARFLQATLSDHGAVGHFNFCTGYAANAGDANRGDHVLTIGYNTTTGGGRANTSEPAFEWRIEDYYNPSGTPFVEAHWQYYDALGNGYRPIACQIDRTNGGYSSNATLALTGSSVSYLGMNGTQYAKFTAGELLLLNSMFVDSYVNNHQWLRQINQSGGGLITLIYVNSSDQVVLSNGTADIKWSKALVSLGGGSAATLGTIGGSGPATAGQNSWMRVIDSAGVAFWVPAWK